MYNFSETIKKVDIFPQRLNILFENGKSDLKTHLGVVFGAIMVVILILYGYMKVEIMIQYKDNTI